MKLLKTLALGVSLAVALAFAAAPASALDISSANGVTGDVSVVGTLSNALITGGGDFNGISVAGVGANSALTGNATGNSVAIGMTVAALEIDLGDTNVTSANTGNVGVNGTLSAPSINTSGAFNNINVQGVGSSSSVTVNLGFR